MVTRRRLVIALGAGAAWPALAWTGMALAQPKWAPILIGWLSVGSRESSAQRFAAMNYPAPRARGIKTA